MMIEQAFDSWHAEPMAGGMRGKHGPPGLTLAERSQLSGIGAAGEASSRRHCWVVGSDDDPGPFPGLVLNWLVPGRNVRAQPLPQAGTMNGEPAAWPLSIVVQATVTID